MGNASHQHITPRGWLNQWAIDGRLVAHPARGGSEPVTLSVRDAAVRSHFYSVKRDDGTYDASAEKDLSRFESRALPILRSLDETWPIRGQDRAIVSEFIALQIARSPEWRAWLMELGKEIFTKYKADGQYADLSEEAWQTVEQANLGDRGLLELMEQHVGHIATMVGAMHWTLITFKREVVIIGDHPVAVIPVDAYWGKVQAQAAPRTGLMRTLEVRMPLSPTHAIVTTWLPGRDQRIDRAWLGHASNINFGIRGQADVHWFTKPGQNITIPTRTYRPFTNLFDPTFSPDALGSSARRQQAQRLIDERIEGEHAGKIPVVEVK